jgi:hypothetical protein
MIFLSILFLVEHVIRLTAPSLIQVFLMPPLSLEILFPVALFKNVAKDLRKEMELVPPIKLLFLKIRTYHLTKTDP